MRCTLNLNIQIKSNANESRQNNYVFAKMILIDPMKICNTEPERVISEVLTA